jgi:hypothetical protein
MTHPDADPGLLTSPPRARPPGARVPYADEWFEYAPSVEGDA